jgi:urease accessory protein
MGETVIVLERCHGQHSGGAHGMQLPLTAEQRTSLRGRRRTLCGQEVLLQLPRQGPLAPGDLLSDSQDSNLVRVMAAKEKLLEVRAESPLHLLQAAYHLGNRHVALDLQPDRLLLLDDPVLASMLLGRGLQVRSCEQPFQPEGGAYEQHHH